MKPQGARFPALTLPAVLLALLLAAAVPAQGGELRMTADSMDILPGGVVTAKGKVSVAGSGFTITGDELTYEEKGDRLSLRGNVLMKEEGRGSFSGEELILDLASGTGGMKRGSIQVEGTRMTLTGDSIARTGPDEYEVEGGTFTTCPPDRCADWSFSASRIRVRREGYLTASGSVFRIAGVPVFYSPFLFFPVKTRRQAGLLLPDFRFSEKTGYDTGLPFYLPLGEAADVTLTPRFFSRGPDGWEGEVRYRLRHGGGGEWSAFTRGREEDRTWYGAGSHAQEAVGGVWARFRWHGAGDPFAPRDYGRTPAERNPGVVLRHATAEAGEGPFTLWAGRSRLLPDARLAGAPGGLARDEAGVRLGFSVGPAFAGLTVLGTRFEEDGERAVARPALALVLPGLGPFRGRAEGEWTRALGGEGTREGSFSLASLLERATLARAFPGGSHRLDFVLTLSRASAASFSSTLRDAADGSAAATLAAGKVVSTLAAGDLMFTLRAGGWRDRESHASQAFGSADLAYGVFSAGASLNRDEELLSALPNPGFGRTGGKGRTVSVRLAGKGGEIGAHRSLEEGSDTLAGDYRLILARFTFSGSASYDRRLEEIVEQNYALAYRGRCWEAAAAWAKRGEDSSVEVRFSLTQ